MLRAAGTGDWGIGFFAAARHAGAFLVEDPELGEVCFLCDIQHHGDGSDAAGVVVKLRDAWRKKLFISKPGLEIISEAGKIESIAVSPSKITVTFSDIATQPLVSVLRLRVEQPAVVSGQRPALQVAPAAALPMKRGAWEVVAAGAGTTTTVVLNVAPI